MNIYMVLKQQHRRLSDDVLLKIKILVDDEIKRRGNDDNHNVAKDNFNGK